uniref:Cystatin domain-containing protein n=1 Tax=Leersia perrieri TaxID=77586 RepID=A0A0D9VR28_9ORYZ
MKSNHLHIAHTPAAITRTISLLLAAVAATATAAPGTIGGWSPIKNTDDPHIQELGQWAVTEENKRVTSNTITFRMVINGEQQLVSGMNYRLTINASSLHDDDGGYKAVVYEQEWTKMRKLISFDKID